MPTDFTVITSTGEQADYRLDGETLPSSEELARLLAEVGLEPSSVEGCPRTGEVLGSPPERAAPSTSALLSVICGPDAGTMLPLTNGVTSIGRGDGCTLTLTDPSVSRQHLEIEVSPRRIVLRPVTTACHVHVDGEQVIEPMTLTPGALIHIADTVLRVSGSLRLETSDSSVPPAAVEFPDVPARRHHPFSLAAALVSCVAGAVAAAVTRSVELLVMAALPALGLIAVSLGSRSSHRRARRRGERDYRAAQAAAEEELARACASEAAQRHRDLPDPAGLAARTAAAPQNGLRVRLGLGQQRASVAIRRGTQTPTYPLLDDVPVCADLADGVLAFCGPLPLARAQARWALCQLANRPGIGVSLWLSHEAEAEWVWARWLPQLRNVHIGDSPPPSGPGTGHHVTVIDHPGADVRETGPLALVVTGTPRAPVVAAQATVPMDDTGLSQVWARAAQELMPFTADLVSVDFAERWARRLARSWEEDGVTTAPPDAALLGLLDLGAIPDAATIATQWQRDPSSVRTPIGVGTAGVIEIDLDRDGPHGLIAGTTGSGKSELLQTMVLGLAVRYRPEAVQFLLVDYKGGAAFGRCADLPHTAGVVTDLDAQQTTRALRSLRAELRRREVLLGTVAAADFAAFHRLGVDAALPPLVVMVDEFATLAAELPDFVAGLVGIAQRGRSLGMHLILATQRPAGVVSPEIRANANLRIALRTISPGESIDVIDRPDAAELDPARPGRAIRGGSGGEQFQVARISGATTRPVTTNPAVTRLGPWRQPLSEPPRGASEPIADSDVLVSQVRAAAELAAVTTPPAPWLPPLPTSIPTLTPGDQSSLTIGMVDLPDDQRQEFLILDLDAGGAYAIAGGPRSGRSTALLTAASTAAAQRSAAELHLHVLDFGGGALRPLLDLPHRGTVIDARDPSGLVGSLIAYLEVEIARRRDTGASAPSVMVVIDDWPALTSAVDAHDLGATSERLRRLLPRCRGTGLTVLLTGDRSVLHPRLASVLDERFTLAFSDPSEYSMVGITKSAVPEVMPPGRGLRVRDTAEIQFALPAPIDNEIANKRRTTGRIELRPLPSLAPSDAMPRRAGYACLGLGGDTAAPVWLSFASKPHLLITGPRRSGRTTMLCSLLDQAVAARCSVAAVASEGSLLRTRAKQHRQPIVDEPIELDTYDLVLVDDAEQIEGTPLAEALEQRLRAAPGGLVVATRSDAALTAFRGVIAELRRAGHGIVLQPEALDAELLGVRLPRPDLGGPPGRGVAVGDPAWGWPRPLEHPQWLAIQTWAIARTEPP